MKDLDARELLIIDDDRSFVQLIMRYLEGTPEGYKVRVAYEGSEALREVRRRPPDVILLDLIMPGMDGFQFLEALHADKTISAIPVLVITAKSFGEDLLAQQGSVIGLARRKPLTPGQVIRALQALLDLDLSEPYPDNVIVAPIAEGV
ncbi:MAG: response regulator [Anaerolineae bacterium]